MSTYRKNWVQYDDGYRLLFRPDHPRANHLGWVKEHIMVAQNSLGKPLPDGAVVHHVDEIRDHNENSNLVICQDQPYHTLLHARLRVVKAGGDPNTDKICYACRRAKPKVEFFSNKSSNDGLSCKCAPCDVAAKCERRRRQKKRMRDAKLTVVES